jgi:hypothetical protein
MKRFACVLLALALFPAFAFGIVLPTEVSTLARNDARSMGMGGTSLLFSAGYDSFFGNPAGFAEKGSLTLGDVSMWGNMPLSPETMNSFFAIQEKYIDEAGRDTIMDGMLAENGKLGMGASIGLGWAGGGFGLGLTMVSDLALFGNSYSESRLVVRNQLNAVVGFGIPIQFGFLRITAGADARGFYRIDTPTSSGWGAYSLVNAVMGYRDDFDSLINAKSLLGGFGYAFDAGITLRAGPLMAGFMARDLFAMLNMEMASVGTIRDSGSLPTKAVYEISIEPTYTAGIGLRFMENGLVAPSLYAQTTDIEGLIAAIKDGADIDTIRGKIQAGAELRLLRIFLLRAGLNSDLLSFGAGVDLALIRVDAAIFATSFEALAGGSSGMAVRVALKL